MSSKVFELFLIKNFSLGLFLSLLLAFLLTRPLNQLFVLCCVTLLRYRRSSKNTFPCSLLLSLFANMTSDFRKKREKEKEKKKEEKEASFFRSSSIVREDDFRKRKETRRKVFPFLCSLSYLSSCLFGFCSFMMAKKFGVFSCSLSIRSNLIRREEENRSEQISSLLCTTTFQEDTQTDWLGQKLGRHFALALMVNFRINIWQQWLRNCLDIPTVKYRNMCSNILNNQNIFSQVSPYLMG